MCVWKVMGLIDSVVYKWIAFRNSDVVIQWSNEKKVDCPKIAVLEVFCLFCDVTNLAPILKCAKRLHKRFKPNSRIVIIIDGDWDWRWLDWHCPADHYHLLISTHDNSYSFENLSIFLLSSTSCFLPSRCSVEQNCNNPYQILRINNGWMTELIHKMCFRCCFGATILIWLQCKVYFLSWSHDKWVNLEASEALVNWFSFVKIHHF